MSTTNEMDDPETRTTHGTLDSSPIPTRQRPDTFSTYVPRQVVRRLKVIAAIRDVPLWAVVTDALHRYLESFEQQHGPLPHLEERHDLSTRSKG